MSGGESGAFGTIDKQNPCPHNGKEPSFDREFAFAECLQTAQKPVTIIFGQPVYRLAQERSSAGRAAVSKTAGRGFEPCRSCHRPPLIAPFRPHQRAAQAGRLNGRSPFAKSGWLSEGSSHEHT